MPEAATRPRQIGVQGCLSRYFWRQVTVILETAGGNSGEASQVPGKPPAVAPVHIQTPGGESWPRPWQCDAKPLARAESLNIPDQDFDQHTAHEEEQIPKGANSNILCRLTSTSLFRPKYYERGTRQSHRCALC